MEVDQSYNGSGQVTGQTFLDGGSAVVTGSIVVHACRRGETINYRKQCHAFLVGHAQLQR